MGTQQLASVRRAGLQTALDIIVAPKAAFERLREIPTWGWAFLISAAIGIVASLLLVPAFIHAFDTSLPAQLAQSPQIARLPADQQQKAIDNALAFNHVFFKFAWLLTPITVLLVALVQSIVLLAANAIAKGDGTFKQLWALAINVGVVGSGLSLFVLTLIVLARGPESFNSTTEIRNVIPGLALIVPAASKPLAAFLGTLNVFALWSAVLFASGLPIVAKMSRGAAATTAAVILLGGGALAAIGATFQK